MSTGSTTAAGSPPPATLGVALGPCSLGAILVAQGPKGVCAVLLGDDAQELQHELARRFPHATLAAGSAATLAAVVAHVERPGEPFALPLDPHGSAFRQRVWRALGTVPAGQTIAYAELARRAGVPAAVRAVAGACAANPLAVVVPCHRVLRSDGSLGGYRWGIERKRALLEREGAWPGLSAAARG